MYKHAVRESGLIICAAALLGFSYTLFAGKGFFRNPDSMGAIPSAKTGPAPSSITLSEAKLLFDTNVALFVDARRSFDFRRGHIKSAINIPLSEYDSSLQTVAALPRDKVIVVYCDASECDSSIELAAKLYERGFGGVRIFFGGWQDWIASRLPTESSQ